MAGFIALNLIVYVFVTFHPIRNWLFVYLQRVYLFFFGLNLLKRIKGWIFAAFVFGLIYDTGVMTTAYSYVALDTVHSELIRMAQEDVRSGSYQLNGKSSNVLMRINLANSASVSIPNTCFTDPLIAIFANGTISYVGVNPMHGKFVNEMEVAIYDPQGYKENIESSKRITSVV